MSNKLPDKIYFTAITKERSAEMFDAPFPAVGPDSVVVKMLANNICTTDYQHWMGLRNHQGFPMAGGHEFAGTIYWKGENVPDKLEVGMQVAVINVPYCGECKFCRQGFTSDCINRGHFQADERGFLGGKCFANFAVFDKKYIIPIDESVTAAEAGLLEPISTVVQGAKKLHIKPAEDVVVIGAGTMGLLNAQVAHAYGARVIITEVDPKKIERAKSMNIGDVIDSKNTDAVAEVKRLTEGTGADAVIVAVGLSIAYKQAHEMLKPTRGRILFFPAGYPKPEFAIDPNAIHYEKLELIGTYASDLDDWYEGAALLNKHLINASYSLEGKVFSLRDIQAAFEAASTPGAYRVTVDLQGI
jgi:L-iditol 2-dehydrogenase